MILTEKQKQTYLQKNYPEKILDEVEKFLELNDYSLFNLAILDSSEYRVMYRDNKTGKVNSQIFTY